MLDNMEKTEEIRIRVYSIIDGLKSVCCDEPVTDDSNLREDLGLESLDYIDLVLQAETFFGIKIKPEEAAKAVLVSDFIKLIEQKVN